MKTKSTLFYFTFFFCSLLAFQTKGQYYQFSQHVHNYEPISNPAYLISDSAIINNYTLLVEAFYSPGTPLKAFGEDIPSKTIYGGTNGFITLTGTDSDFAFDIFLKDLRSNGQSEFRSDEIFIEQDTILEIEWSNFRIAGHPDTDFINMKARFYVTKELVEFYYGPSNISEPLTSNIGMVKATPGFTSFLEVIFLNGNPASPTLVTTGVSFINGFPSNGTLYRFTGPTLVGLEDHDDQVDVSITLSPNPAKDQVTIKSTETVSQMDILSSTGVLVDQVNVPFDQINLPLVNFSKGLYIISCTFKNGNRQQQKLLID